MDFWAIVRDWEKSLLSSAKSQILLITSTLQYWPKVSDLTVIVISGKTPNDFSGIEEAPTQGGGLWWAHWQHLLRWRMLAVRYGLAEF